MRSEIVGRLLVVGAIMTFPADSIAEFDTLAESNASYGKPIQNTSLAYQPLMVQLGFRLIF